MITVTGAEVISLLAVLVAAIGVVLSFYMFRSSINRTMNENAAKVGERITVLETKMEVFWSGISLDLATVLHHPHPEFAERDNLLELFLAGDINESQLDRLRELLRHAVGDIDTESPSAGERVAASILLRLLDAQAAISIMEKNK